MRDFNNSSEYLPDLLLIPNLNSVADTDCQQQSEEHSQQDEWEDLEKFMPLGSVVTLEGDTDYTQYMIIGYNPEDGMDYLACAFPYGVCRERETISFCHDSIQRIYHTGFVSDHSRHYRKLLSSAIIFDLDGTLWDSTESICEIWNTVIEQDTKEHPGLTREHIRALMGMTMEDIAAALFPDKPKSEQTRLMGLCSKAENEYLSRRGAILYDDLEDTLRTLSKDHRLFIVSNCQEGYIQAFLEAHKLGQYFTDFEMYGRTGKPKRDNIRLLMERNSLTEAVYVGDTDGDQFAARCARIPFIFAAYGFGSASYPDGIIHSLKELPACLRQLADPERLWKRLLSRRRHP